MGPRGRFYPYLYQMIDIGIGYITGLYLGRAFRTKETLPDFLKWRRVTRHPLVFRGLTGSRRTPGFWDVTDMVSGIRIGTVRLEAETNRPSRTGLGRVFEP